MQGTGSSGPATPAGAGGGSGGGGGGSIVGVGSTTAPATPAGTTGNAADASGANAKGRKTGEHRVYFAPVRGGSEDAEDVKNPEGEKFIADGIKRARAKASDIMDVDAATKSPKAGAKGRKGAKGKGRAKR